MKLSGLPSAEIVYGPSGYDKEQENEDHCQRNIFFAQGLVNGQEEVFTPETSIAHFTSKKNCKDNQLFYNEVML